ncbi:PREDICTED: THAP domain-containing protein 2-like [Trachymyrmex cornetzi]|uniref:THAP domain-containing protein 2-like n=1 Tax=Trachymyrmex cornetzi TaxID=471704 RepID=UPI00084ED7D2|nr:PREDICTED: THAP domain-containing protein 2-like [Trachymyrmex cornetzi]
MGGCSALNCKNRSEAGFQTFRFPTEAERRKKWLINCRRDKWIPSSNSRLCEIHFESSQFEQNRQDGLRKLKPNAVPTLFDMYQIHQKELKA